MSGFPLPPIVVELVVQVAGSVVGAFLRTTLGMVVLGIAAAVGSFWYAAQASTLQGVLAAVAAVVICGIAGVILATKRAALHGVRELARRHHVGGRIVGAVFDRIGGLPGAGVVGKIPFAQAETWLATAVRDNVDGDGFLRRRIAARLLTSVQALTLARFRQADATEGGVDLALVRADLVARADDLLDGHVSSLARRLTIVVVIVAVAGSCIAALAIGSA